jgi:hypothetical protein
LALPRPHHALPRLDRPSPSPRHAAPHHACLALPASPCRAGPRPTNPGLTEPRLPGHVRPSPATPCLAKAMPCLTAAGGRRQKKSPAILAEKRISWRASSPSGFDPSRDDAILQRLGDVELLDRGLDRCFLIGRVDVAKLLCRRGRDEADPPARERIRFRRHIYSPAASHVALNAVFASSRLSVIPPLGPCVGDATTRSLGPMSGTQ